MITRILRISDHPVSKYPDDLKARYLRGLGCVLHSVSDGHSNMKLLFEQWSRSILPEADVDLWFSSENLSVIKKAVSINRIGIKFFRLKHQFYFDCFYLTEVFDPRLLARLNEFINENGRNLFTKAAISQTKMFFELGDTELRLEKELIEHRDRNSAFEKEKEKNILVVATVSAGKSTLINALIGHFFTKTQTGVCTTRICKIHNKQYSDGITYKKEKLYSHERCLEVVSSEDTAEAGFHFESALGNQRLCLIDTPGVNNSKDETHWKITTEAIKTLEYDLAIFISNGLYNGTNDERRLLNFIKSETNKPVIFILNQLDKFNPKVDNISQMIYDYSQELMSIGFKSPEVYPTSAQYALLLRKEENLDEDEIDELQSMRNRFSKPYFDLPKYIGKTSANEIEKSGICLLEKAIINAIK